MPIKDDGQIMQVDLNDYYKPEWLGGRFYGGAGHWSHQYNSQQFNFGFLGPSAFDRLYGAGTFLNLLKAERISGGLSVNPSRFAFVLDALQAGFQFSVLEAFGKRTLVYSLGAIGNIIFGEAGEIRFSNRTASELLDVVEVSLERNGNGGVLRFLGEYKDWTSVSSYGLGLSSGMVREASRGLTTTTSKIASEVQAARVIGRIGTAAKFTGYLGNTIGFAANTVTVINDPSAANYARLAVNTFAIGLNLFNFVAPGLGTGLSILVSTIDGAGGFNWLYNSL